MYFLTFTSVAPVEVLHKRFNSRKKWNLRKILSVYGAILATIVTVCFIVLTCRHHHRGNPPIYKIEESAPNPRLFLEVTGDSSSSAIRAIAAIL